MEIDSIGLHLPSHKMGGQGRKTIITYNSPKRYRRGKEKSDCKLSVQCLTFGEKAHIIKTIKVVIKLVI